MGPLKDVARRSVFPIAALPVLSILLTALLFLGPTPPIAALRVAPAPLTTLTSGGCPGARVPFEYNVTLAVNSTSSSPPSVVGQTVGLSYFYVENHTIYGSPRVSTLTCHEGWTNVTTTKPGSSLLAATLPTNTSSSNSEQNYSGFFGPVAFGFPRGLPTGYALNTSQRCTTVTLTMVGALASVSVSPSSPVTVSTFEPVNLTGAAWAGNGSASPATLTYSWKLSGVEWVALGGATSSRFQVESYIGGSPGLAQLWVNGTFNGSPVLHATPVLVDLLSVTTAITSASAQPTAVDVGVPVAFVIVGTGAAGVLYNASVNPGLGLAPLSTPCLVAPTGPGTVRLTCNGQFRYPSPGVALPVATLSNGYSFAIDFVPTITIVSNLSLVVAPSSLSLYVGDPGTISLSVASGTGTAPYGPACLETGDGRTVCQGVSTGHWNFSVSYPQSGGYTANLSMVDGDGVNVSRPVAVVVYGAPKLSAIASSGPEIAGLTGTFTVHLLGGVPPFKLWWNLSGSSSPLLTTSALTDGWLSVSFTPTVAGPALLSFSVTDALGSRAASTLSFSTAPGSASAISVVGGSSGSLPAGGRSDLSWGAFDPYGNRESVFEANLVIAARPPNGATGTGVTMRTAIGTLLPSVGGDRFWASASDWARGTLNLSAVPLSAGLWTFSVAPGVPYDVSGSNATWLVGPDLNHLSLRSPITGTTNATTNDTLWTVTDIFGNPAWGATIVVQADFGARVLSTESHAIDDQGRAAVWVNYTISGSDGGTVYVFGPNQTLLLAPIQIPPAAPQLDVGVLLGLGAVGVGLAVAGFGYLREKRRSHALAPLEPAGVEEVERFALGCDALLATVGRTGSADLETIALAWSTEPVPTAQELFDWVTALVTDGRLTTEVDARRLARFALRSAVVEVVPPRVELHPEVLDEALRARDAKEGSESP